MTEPILQKVHLASIYTASREYGQTVWAPTNYTYCGEYVQSVWVYDHVFENEIDKVTCEDCIDAYALEKLAKVP